jgi:hypothetical protein
MGIYFTISIPQGNRNMVVKTLRNTLFTVVLVLSGCGGLSMQQVQNEIDSTKELRDLDLFCKDLPRPDTFRLTGKRLGGNSDVWYIVYLYRSEQSFESAKDFMSEYFGRLQWQMDPIVNETGAPPLGRVEFRSGKRFVTLDHVAFDDANYAIGCGAEK